MHAQRTFLIILNLLHVPFQEMWTAAFFQYEKDWRMFSILQPKTSPHFGEYNVYSTFQSHEPDFDYLKSLDIDEKINQIKWLQRCNAAHFLLSTNGMCFFVWTYFYKKTRIWASTGSFIKLPGFDYPEFLRSFFHVLIIFFFKSCAILKIKKERFWCLSSV